LVDPLFLKVVMGGVAVAYLPEGFDPCLPSPEVGLDAVAEVAARESAKADLSGEVVLAGAVDGDEVHGAEGAEHAESLADGAFAQVKAGDEVVEGQGLLAAVEEAVDFPQRARQGEDGKGPDEEVDGFTLKGSEGQGSLVHASGRNGSYAAALRNLEGFYQREV